jgi:hypothetical protein
MGMFFSAISKDERKSLVATFLLLLFFVGGLPLLGGLLAEITHDGKPFPMFFILSPGYQSFAAFDETFNMLAFQGFNYFYAVGLSSTGYCARRGCRQPFAQNPPISRFLTPSRQISPERRARRAPNPDCTPFLLSILDLCRIDCCIGTTPRKFDAQS